MKEETKTKYICDSCGEEIKGADTLYLVEITEKVDTDYCLVMTGWKSFNKELHFCRTCFIGETTGWPNYSKGLCGKILNMTATKTA